MSRSAAQITRRGEIADAHPEVEEPTDEERDFLEAERVPLESDQESAPPTGRGTPPF